MRILSDINLESLALRKPGESEQTFQQRKARAIAMVARAYLYASTAANELLMADKEFPPLYQSGVKYRREPWQGEGFEEFATADVVLSRGWGDCDDLVAYRVAELRKQGEKAGVRVHWRPDSLGNARAFHVTVRRAPTKEYPQGRIEDPSRYLGM